MFMIIDYADPSLTSPDPEYSSNAQNISSILYNMGASSIIIHWNDPFPAGINLIGVILTGGPEHVYNEGSSQIPTWLPSINVPILGICYGMQLIAKFFGGKVIPTPTGEFSPTYIHLTNPDRLLGLTNRQLVWMNHHDIVETVPENFQITSVSDSGYISSITNGRWWGVQFHPEIYVAGTNGHYGKTIFQNFINICIVAALDVHIFV